MSNKIKVKVTRFTLPLFWRKEIKVWYGIIANLSEASYVYNPNTAGNPNTQYYEIEVIKDNLKGSK